MHAQYQTVIEHFHADAAFRQAVLADANGAVKQAFGIDLPGQVQVVADASGYRIEPVASADMDLSDEQLDLVAGGKPTSPPRTSTYVPPSYGIISNNGAGVVSNNGGNFRF